MEKKMKRYALKHFSLMELMIIIAIIAILMSLLLPGLGRARYKAKLVKCMNNLSQQGKVLNTAGRDNNLNHWNRYYPYKPTSFTGYRDNRPELIGYAGSKATFNEVFSDPMLPKTPDLATATNSHVESSYTIWANFEYTNTGNDVLRKIYDTKFTYNGNSFNILSSDYRVRIGNYSETSHNTEHSGLKHKYSINSGDYLGFSRYEGQLVHKYRQNFLKTDLSVYQTWDTGDFVTLPVVRTGSWYPGLYYSLPTTND